MDVFILFDYNMTRTYNMYVYYVYTHTYMSANLHESPVPMLDITIRALTQCMSPKRTTQNTHTKANNMRVHRKMCTNLSLGIRRYALK